MEGVEDLLVEMNELELPLAIMNLLSKLMDTYDSLKGNRKHVTVEVIAKTKKIHEYVADRMISVYKENIILTTKLSEMERRNEEYLRLMEKVGRKSEDIIEEEPRSAVQIRRPQKDDHAVIISAVHKDQDIDDLKRSIKQVCKSSSTITAPGDVMVTRLKQVILRVNTRKEATEIQNLLKESEDLKDKARVVVPYRKRERLLILSVDPEVTEEMVTRDIGRNMDDILPEADLIKSLSNKLKDPALTGPARLAIEDLYNEQRADFRIVKKINTKVGKVNWLIDVDKELSERLLDKRRICIDYERYRVVQFVTIIRCFKCQEFGHMSGQCKGELRCPKCSDEHMLADCKSLETRCANCYFSDKDSECSHRADSPDCPAFKNYRGSLLPQRL